MTPAPGAAAPEDSLRILRLEAVDFCCGEVLPEPQVWVLAEDRVGRRFSCRISAARAAELGLSLGGACRRADLRI